MRGPWTVGISTQVKVGILAGRPSNRFNARKQFCGLSPVLPNAAIPSLPRAPCPTASLANLWSSFAGSFPCAHLFFNRLNRGPSRSRSSSSDACALCQIPELGSCSMTKALRQDLRDLALQRPLPFFAMRLLMPTASVCKKQDDTHKHTRCKTSWP